MHAALEFRKPIWTVISDQAKDLIKKMLVRNPIERLSAEEVTKNGWFCGKYQSKDKDFEVDAALLGALENMRRFKVFLFCYSLRI